MFGMKNTGMGKLSRSLIALTLVGLASCDDNATDPVGADSSNSSTTAQTQGDGNDEAAAADTLQWGVSKTVNLSSNEDVDWYRLVAPRGGVLKFNVEGLPLSTTSSDLYEKIYVEKTNTVANSATITLDGKDYFTPAQVKLGDTVWIKLYTNSYGKSFPSSKFTVRADLDTCDNGEWNDVQSHATPLTVDASPTVFKLYPTGDVDWFKFTLTQNALVGLRIDTGASDSLIHKGQHLFTSLMDAEGSTNCDGCFKDETNGDNLGLNSQLALKAGTYYTKVTSYTSGLIEPYYMDKPLRIQVKQDKADRNGWHNDKASAITLKDGDTTWSALSASNDTDWFKIFVNAGDTLKIGIDSLSSKLSTFRYDLLDEALTRLDYWYNFTPNGNICKRVATASGTYYIKFYNQRSSGYSQNPYRITAAVKPLITDSNDVQASPTLLSWGVSRTVNLKDNNDVDWYRLVAPRGGVLKFNIEGLPLSTTSSDLYEKIYVESPSTVTNSATITLDGKNYSTPAQVKPGDTVWIKVYTSSYGNPFPSANFTVRADLDTSDNGEWNDAQSRATPLTVDAAPTTMKLYPEGDVDWFRFTLEKNSLVQFRIDTGYSDSFIYQGQALRSSLLDGEGNSTSYGCFGLASWIASSDVGRNTFRALKAGTYQIQATLASGSKQYDKPLRIQINTNHADPLGWHNDKSSAVVLQDGDTAWSALSAPNDTDWFQITVNAGDTLKVGIDSIPSSMTSFQYDLYDESLTRQSYWNGLASNGNLCKRALATAGTYYLRFLSPSSQYSQKPYRISTILKPKK